MGMNPKSSLCWDCKNSVDKGCSWAESFVPVRDWNAEKATVDGQTSYCVIDCPEFIRDAYSFGRYSPEQYIEHLEKLVERLRGKIDWLNSELKRMEADAEQESKTGRPRKRFIEESTKRTVKEKK